MTTPDENGNGVKVKVDLAVVNTKVDMILARMDKLDAKFDAQTCEGDRRDERITRLESRTDALAVANGMFTAVAAALAGWFGSRP